MSLLDEFRSAALERNLIDTNDELDPGLVFTLVRDMTYQRASNRDPETIIAEWRGTCSGKHYLLHKLFAELGLDSEIIACTSAEPVDQDNIPETIKPLYESANRRFVDVHNYLLLMVPGGDQMIVDATFPLSSKHSDLVVNEQFVLGQNQQIAANPIKTFTIPQGRDPQEFKAELLNKYFTSEELEFREAVIEALSSG